MSATVETPIVLINLSRVIAQCWVSAEKQLRGRLLKEYQPTEEEQITFLFRAALRQAVRSATRRREFENAFVADLSYAYSERYGDVLPHDETERFSHGLVGSVSFHNRHYEGRQSGADIGIIVTQPWADHGEGGICVKPAYGRALLAQAKLGRPTRGRSTEVSWGRLTGSQEKLIPEHAEYYSLLLYRFGDLGFTLLDRFRWQLCRGFCIDEIKGWLRCGRFPAEKDSAEVIAGLAIGTVGTADQRVCSELANPAGRRAQCIEIRVSWPDHRVPPDGVMLRRQVEEPQLHMLRYDV